MDRFDKLLELLQSLLYLLGLCDDYICCDSVSMDNFSNKIDDFFSIEEVCNFIENISISDFSKEKLYNGSIKIKMDEIRKIIVYIENIDVFLDYAINKLYENLSNDVSISYPFLINNLDGFRKIIDNSSLSSLLSYVDTLNIDENEIPTLTQQELVDIVVEFLSYIDSTDNLKNTFLQYYNNGRILLWDVNSNEVPQHIKGIFGISGIRTWFVSFNGDTQEKFINAPCRGNLIDAFCLIHELFHCIYGSTNVYSSIFCEFPSIFMEEVFKEFLLMKGLKNEVILGCMKFREENNTSVIKELSEDILFLSKKLVNITLTKNDLCEKFDIEETMQYFSKMDQKLCDEFQLLLEQANNDADLNAINKFEFKLMYLKASYFFDSFKYFVAKDLAIKMLECNNINDSIKKLLSLQSTFINSNMSEHYYFSYLEIWDYYYLLRNNSYGDKVHPARIESKEKIKIIEC